jgi:HTH-type transcriptional regulator / antitoxin HigA
MTLTPKVIKTEIDYDAALARIEEIFTSSPSTPEGDELELLTMLVEQYEEVNFPIDLPDPVTAIRFRMEQMGLKQKDLVPFIGSQSKVSEVLSGSRPLSLSMIRNLVRGLDIPAEVLLQESGAQIETQPPSWADLQFPFNEMFNRGWFEGFHGTLSQAKAQSEELLAAFFAPMGTPNATWNCALNRQHVRSRSKVDECALTAWRVRVVTLAQRETISPYKPKTVTPEFLRELVALSYFEEGPKLAKELLGKRGIPLIIEPHLPKTFLDGAALKMPDGSPMVALTIRHDRLDNFWFTLVHELAHIALHIDQEGVEAFFDDLTEEGNDECEKEADEMATQALVPEDKWKEAALGSHSTAVAVRELAEKLRVSPALPAGRLRHQLKNYRILQDLIGNGKVRLLFN